MHNISAKHIFPQKECWLTGFLFSIFSVFGHEISRFGRCDYSLKGWLIRILCLLGAGCVFSFLLELFYRWLSQLGIKGHYSSNRTSSHFKTFLYERPLPASIASGLFILLCWFPVFLAFYPGVYAYDTPNQTYQMYAGAYNTHHPLLHTLFMDFFVFLGRDLLSYNFGIALSTIMQMLLLSIILSCCLFFLLKWKAPLWLFILTLLFFALYPTNSLFAINATKDTLFSGLFLLTAILLLDLLRGYSDKKALLRTIALYIPAAALTCLFRNNGIYTLLFMLLFLPFARKGKRIPILLATIASVLIFVGTNYLFDITLHPQKGSIAEMLSVPIQQFGRTVAEHGSELSSQDYEQLSVYIQEEKLFLYNPVLSDPVKDGFNEEAFYENTKGFIRTWFSFLRRYPDTFADAFLCSSFGNWYPGTDFSGYLELSVKDMWGKLPDMHRNSKLPFLENALTAFFHDRIYQKVPVLSLFFNPVLFIWGLFIILGWLFRTRQTALLPAVIPYIGLWGTLLLGPIALVRYIFPIILSLPLMLFLLFCSSHRAEEDPRPVQKESTNIVES